MRRLTPDTVQQNERNTAIFTEMMVGGMGFDIINDTANHVGNYFKIVPITTTATVTSATYYPGYSAGSLSAIPIPQGFQLYADFMSVQLSSGTVIGYFMY